MDPEGSKVELHLHLPPLHMQATMGEAQQIAGLIGYWFLAEAPPGRSNGHAAAAADDDDNAGVGSGGDGSGSGVGASADPVGRVTWVLRLARGELDDERSPTAPGWTLGTSPATPGWALGESATPCSISTVGSGTSSALEPVIPSLSTSSLVLCSGTNLLSRYS